MLKTHTQHFTIPKRKQQKADTLVTNQTDHHAITQVRDSSTFEIKP